MFATNHDAAVALLTTSRNTRTKLLLSVRRTTIAVRQLSLRPAHPLWCKPWLHVAGGNELDPFLHCNIHTRLCGYAILA